MNDMLSCSFCASVMDFCYSVCRWDSRIGVMSSSLFKSVLIGAQRVVAALLRPVAFHLVTVANSLQLRKVVCVFRFHFHGPLCSTLVLLYIIISQSFTFHSRVPLHSIIVVLLTHGVEQMSSYYYACEVVSAFCSLLSEVDTCDTLCFIDQVVFCFT